jgi:uncharacterized protein
MGPKDRRPTSRQGDEHFFRASELWERGNARQAFRVFLKGAKLGDVSCQLNVGYLYDEGRGVKRSETKALYWYRRAYRKGNSSAAANIGLLLRGPGKHRPSLDWLMRALKMGDRDSALAIGQTYLEIHRDPVRALKYLRLAVASAEVTESTRTAARTLLARAAKLARRKAPPE